MSMSGSWMLIKSVTLGILVLICLILFSNVLSGDLNTTQFYIYSVLISIVLVFGLIGIFLKPRAKRNINNPIPGKSNNLSINAAFGILSILLILLLFGLRTYILLELTSNMTWQNYFWGFVQIFIPALLIVVYIELLWSLLSFYQENYRDEVKNMLNYEKTTQIHYLKYFPVLTILSGLFILIAAIFTTFIIFSSEPAFIHSLASGSVYPFFIIGVILLGSLSLLYGAVYLWHRYVKLRSEKVLE